MATYFMKVRFHWQFGILIPVFIKIQVFLDIPLQAYEGWWLPQASVIVYQMIRGHILDAMILQD